MDQPSPSSEPPSPWQPAPGPAPQADPQGSWPPAPDPLPPAAYPRTLRAELPAVPDPAQPQPYQPQPYQPPAYAPQPYSPQQPYYPQPYHPQQHAQPHYGQPYHPQSYGQQYGHQQPAQRPARRTEFGWASIVVGGIAMLTSWIPVFGWLVMGMTALLVLAGMLGRGERSRFPAVFGAGMLVLALALHVLIWQIIEQYLPG